MNKQIKEFISSTIILLTFIVTSYLMLDLIGFVMWFSSGQTPPDGYYIGKLITELIKLVI